MAKAPIYEIKESRVGAEYQVSWLPEVGDATFSSSGAGADEAELIWAPRDEVAASSADGHGRFLRRWSAHEMQEEALATLCKTGDVATAEEQMSSAKRKRDLGAYSLPQYSALGAALTAAIIESRRDLSRARRELQARGLPVTLNMLQRFYYTQFRRSPEGMQLCNAMEAEIETDDGYEDHCAICDTRGFLVCCDGCSNVYHLACVGLTAVPDGDWHCPQCLAQPPGASTDTKPHPPSSAAPKPALAAAKTNLDSSGGDRAPAGNGLLSADASSAQMPPPPLRTAAPPAPPPSAPAAVTLATTPAATLAPPPVAAPNALAMAAPPATAPPAAAPATYAIAPTPHGSVTPVLFPSAPASSAPPGMPYDHAAAISAFGPSIGPYAFLPPAPAATPRCIHPTLGLSQPVSAPQQGMHLIGTPSMMGGATMLGQPMLGANYPGAPMLGRPLHASMISAPMPRVFHTSQGTAYTHEPATGKVQWIPGVPSLEAKPRT